MYNKLTKLASLWGWQNNEKLTTEIEIKSFQTSNNLLIPPDLVDYFKQINGTDGYDDCFFEFFSLQQFQSIKNHFEKWHTVFDFAEFLNKFGSIRSCFVFANYQTHLFSYAIQLTENEIDIYNIFIFCGNNYKLIANSFNEFIDLCLNDSRKLFFND